MSYIAAYPLAAGLSFLLYFLLKKGLSVRADHQQLPRFLLGALFAVAPAAITGADLLSPAMLIVAGIALLWMLTYPVLYFVSNHKTDPEINPCIDIASGLYFYGLLSGLVIICETIAAKFAWVTIIPAIPEAILAGICIAQIGYYIIYKQCIDIDGMLVVQETNRNEILEFFRSFGIGGTLGMLIAILIPAAAIVWINVGFGVHIPAQHSFLPILGAVLTSAISAKVLFTGRKAAFRRCGIVNLYNDTLRYREERLQYREYQQKRYDALQVTPNRSSSQPETIILVIGESASRDYMTAFSGMMPENTPWLSAMAKDPEHWFLLKKAYSCDVTTVPSVSGAMTEFNQYDGIGFNDACSVIDIAHKAGYRVYWYSNQGFIGVADTPVSVIASTADVAKWTKQQVGVPYYDEALLDFLPEINPDGRNLIVLHLKGSHFNFESRYPEEFASKKGKDNIAHFRTSLQYTDHILRQVYEYARKHLNLSAMVYFSDHATLADKKRAPKFSGFGEVHIPAFIHLTEEYRREHPHVAEGLDANRDKYWTNDLAYELMCSIFDISSPHFNPQNSIASPAYRHTRDTLTTWGGKKRIADDPT